MKRWARLGQGLATLLLASCARVQRGRLLA